MTYWSVAILIVSVSFLAYRHPPASWTTLPPWLRSRTSKALANDGTTSKHRNSDLSEDTPAVKQDAPSFNLSAPEVPFGEDEGTPKADATVKEDAVPAFSLPETEAPMKMNGFPAEPPKPSFPAANSAQRASTMAPPSRPGTTQTTSSLMPPPTPKPASLIPPPGRANPLPQRLPASNSSSLRIPSSGPLPNRGPPANSAQRAGSNSRGKILLSPGHSPMDWAALSRSSNLSGVPTLQRVTPSQLKTMTGRKGKPAWSSYQGKVYNITPYLPFHPGGEPELMKAAGRDGGKLFMEVHPWVNWEGMLGQSCVVGILVSESEGVNPLDEQD